MHKKVEYHLKQLKTKLISQCKYCNGKGCTYCAMEFDLHTKYAQAGIPIKYWDLNLTDLDPNGKGVKEVTNYVKKLKLAYMEGQGLLAYGKNGNGKTLCACAIGKEAIKQGYSVRFTFLGEIIAAFMNTMYDSKQRERLKDDILGVDFLILDDIDKAYISEDSKYVNSILDTLFRTRVQNNLPVIMTANKPINNILQSNSEEVFTKSLLSLFDESLLSVLFYGSDKRSELKTEARKRFLED